MKEYILENVDQMRAWARGFAKTLKAPCVIALNGDLGMGKSEIARSIKHCVVLIQLSPVRHLQLYNRMMGFRILIYIVSKMQMNWLRLDCNMLLKTISH